MISGSELRKVQALKKIYNASPVWGQNLMVSTQGFINNHWRWDLRLARDLLADLRESQWRDEKESERFSNPALHDHVRKAVSAVPFYRDLFGREGLDPDGIRSIEDLRAIPMLDKRTIRERPSDFLSGGRPRRSWNNFFTSGTTGSPMNLYSSRASFTRIWSFVFRLREWAGLSDPIFPRRVQFTGRDIVPDAKIRGGKVFWRRNLPGNALLMSTSHLSVDTVPAYAAAMRRFGPELIDGYPSAILILARVAKALGIELPRPVAVITSAETLFPEDRAAIEAAFGCKVFNQYASSDTAAFICDCELGSLHINPEFGICEILNSQGRPASPGEEGEIVATSFLNSEQVFIRYRIGDTAVPGPDEPCPCGRKMPRVRAITGRVDDTIYIPDRGFVGRLDPIFKGLSGIYEAQIIQESLESLRVRLVPDPSYDASAEKELLGNLRNKVGDSVAIAVERIGAIPRGPNGKFRSVVSMCRDRYPGL